MRHRRGDRLPGALGAGGLRAWARRHAYSLLSSLGTLIRQPLASIMTIVVLAITLSLPSGLFVALDNLARMTADWERLDTLSVFLASELDDDQALRMASRWSAQPDIVAVDPVSPAQGLAEMAGQLDLPDLTSLVSDNPLPWVLEVTPAPAADVPTLIARLEADPQVDQVIVDLRWLERLDAMVALLEEVVALLALLFAVAVAFIVGNTIRLDIQHKREEIEVMTLVGATGSFVRRPFLYSGLWYGLAGGVLAWLIIRVGLLALAEPVDLLSGAYASGFALQPPSMAVSAMLIGGSGALGVAGSWLAVGRHLRRIHSGR